MKSTGIVRQVDNLDRIVIPKELCKTLGIEPKSPIEIYVQDGRIVLKKYEVVEGPFKAKGSLGIVRQVDALDRIVIPKEICKILDIEPKNSMEIFIDENHLILGKYNPSCIFCGEVDDVVMYKKKLVCRNCVNNLHNML